MSLQGISLAALLAALLVTGGCLESEADLTLAADGSGTWRQRSHVRMAKVEALLSVLSGQTRELEPEDNERARHDDVFPDLDVEERHKALAKRKGIKVIEATVTSNEKEKTHTTVLAVRFASLKALFESGAAEDVTASLEKNAKGQWKLTLRHAHLEGVIEAASERLKKVREHVLETFKPHWGDLTIDIKMTLPTKVVSTNGSANGRVVRFRVRYADLADPKKLVHVVTFEDAEGLELEPFEAIGGSK